MSLEGRVHDGMIVFEQPLPLAEGTRVRIEVCVPKDPPGEQAGSLLDELGDVVGALDDLPEDLAAEHDHYLYGTPKRS